MLEHHGVLSPHDSKLPQFHTVAWSIWTTLSTWGISVQTLEKINKGNGRMYWMMISCIGIMKRSDSASVLLESATHRAVHVWGEVEGFKIPLRVMLDDSLAAMGAARVPLSANGHPKLDDREEAIEGHQDSCNDELDLVQLVLVQEDRKQGENEEDIGQEDVAELPFSTKDICWKPHKGHESTHGKEGVEVVLSIQISVGLDQQAGMVAKKHQGPEALSSHSIQQPDP